MGKGALRTPVGSAIPFISLSGCDRLFSESCMHDNWGISLECWVESQKFYFDSGLWIPHNSKCRLSLQQTEGEPHIMDHRVLQELSRILRTHEEMVKGNGASILTLISKFHEYEQQFTSQIAEVINTLVQVKPQLVTLEAECNFLKKTGRESE